MQYLYKIRTYHLEPESTHTFRSGSRYQILFVIRGSCQLYAAGKKWICRSSDIILLKPEQSQTLAPSTPKLACALLCVSIPVESLAALSDATCDLVQHFGVAPYDVSVICAEIKSVMLIRNMITKLDTLKEETVKIGTELYEKSLFTTFLVLFLRTCVQSDQVHQSRQKKILIIDDVFQYISHHLTEDLSLKTLEREFFVSGEHISREFKKRTGITLHAYITRSRIDLSKKYLLQGIPVRDVCQLCGFSSYNHFFKLLIFIINYGRIARNSCVRPSIPEELNILKRGEGISMKLLLNTWRRLSGKKREPIFWIALFPLREVVIIQNVYWLGWMSVWL